MLDATYPWDPLLFHRAPHHARAFVLLYVLRVHLTPWWRRRGGGRSWRRRRSAWRTELRARGVTEAAAYEPPDFHAEHDALGAMQLTELAAFWRELTGQAARPEPASGT